MYQRTLIYIRRVIHVFSTRLRVLTLLAILVLTGWFVTQFVLAEKTLNVYIFPSAVNTDGWDNEIQSLAQDLSPEAQLADFNSNNSAVVMFGNPQVETSSTTTTITPSVSGDNASPSFDSLPLVPAIVNTVSAGTSDTKNASQTPSSLPEVPLPNLFSPINISPEIASTSPSSLKANWSTFASSFFGTKIALAVGGVASSTSSSSTIATLTATTSSSSLSGVTQKVTPMSDDPYTVASCTTLGLPCHLMTFVGFGLAGALSDKQITGATLELSLAGRGDLTSATHDRVLVRIYHNGRWEYLGETEVKGEFSNAKRGGYLSYELPLVANWSDLADVKVVVEYVREGAGDASAYVDGIWINAKYSADSLSGVASPDELALTAANLRSTLATKDVEERKAKRDILETPEGQVIPLTHVDEHSDAKIVIKSDKELYHTFGDTSAYMNVTNMSDTEQSVRLQFHFPEAGGHIASLSQFSRNVPYKVGGLKYDSVGYFCATGWESATGTKANTYACMDTSEVRTCDALNEDKTNCILNDARVGLTEDTEYRNGWTSLPLASGSFREAGGLFAKAIDFILGQLPKDIIPPSETPVSYIGEAILLLPGQTVYVRADLSLPINARGDFYVEAAAESGEYGLLHAGWDGSWNYRVAIAIDNDKVDTTTAFAVPISLDNLPKAFWNRVKGDGSDIRFADEEGSVELPYWLASFDYKNKSGLAWVRIAKTSQSTTTSIALYYGNTDADAHSDSIAPFRTDNPTPRAVVFGSSQQDMTVHAIALAENEHVQIGANEVITLKKGESALFRNVAPGQTILADGPVALSLGASTPNVAIVPYGFAGINFIAPAISGERSLALAAIDDDVTHVELRKTEGTTSLDPMYGTIVSDALTLDKSVRIDANNDVIALLSASDTATPAPLYPATNETLYGFAIGKTIIGFGADSSNMTAECSSGGRESVDGRREGMSTSITHCQSSNLPPLADSIRVHELSNPVSALALSGEALLGYLPKSEFASSYTLTEDASELVLLCAPEDGAINVGVFDREGTSIASTTCEGRGQRPGKAMLINDSGFSIGSTVRSLDASSTAFLVATQAMGRALSGGEVAPTTILYGTPLYRMHSPNHPKIIIGDEEFVIPGEHRKLDVDKNGKERSHVDKLLTTKREFSIHQQPGFQFQYTPQSNSLMQGIRNAFGVAPFSVTKVTLKHPLFGESDADYDIGYGDNNVWSLTLKNTKEHLHPGKYTLHVEIEEGGATYTDEFDFYWGVLAINYNKSVFTPNETAQISIGALSDNGNTICDAPLKLWVTPPSGTESEIPVTPSSVCKGNNVVDVPDYTASYKFESATGTYAIKLVRFDENGNIASQVTDSISVEDSVPIIIERDGPTRIYPVAHYPMKLRVTANQDFKGNIVERLPGDFVLIDRGSADLQWGDEAHTFITASWPVDMKKGQVVSFSYIFDAPDRSPFLYEIGPAKADGDIIFTEARFWQVASDAIGKTYIYWDQTFIPTGWTCVSCSSGQPFYQKFMQGSSTYNAGLGGGNATDTPTASATVYTTGATGVGSVSIAAPIINTPIGHSHTFTPAMSGASNNPAYRQLVVLQSNSAGDPSTLPNGAIVAFDVASSSLPAGWNRYTPLDGRYIFSESTSTVNINGGANTHSQTVTGTLTAAPESGLRSNGGTGLAAASTHTHTLTATSTNVQNTEPPYVEMVFAKLTATSAPANNIVLMWDDTPSLGWVTLSNAGGVLNNKFAKASTTYGGTGGAVFHTYSDIIGATTSAASASNNYNANAALGQAIGTHTHNVDITGFSTDDTRPPYIDVIFAKRLVNIVFWTQDNYRFYTNVNANTVTDPWPTGASDLVENTPIDSATTLAKPSDVIRLRMNLSIANATATPSTQAFKLQYVAGTDCVNALNWTDVAPVGSSTSLWRGYDNVGVVNGVLLATSTLSASTVAESYVEANNSPTNPATTTIGTDAEWDWVLQDNLAVSATNYCFRMVKNDGTPLDAYTNYPQILTNTQPNQPTQSTPFNNQKVATILPDFNFISSDNEADDLDYEIQVSISNTFGSTVIDKDSTINPELFDNLDTPANKAPFNSGDTIHFLSTSALTNGTTYWWRVRAKDSNGSNSWGSWSASYSLTIDTSVVLPTWHQTTSEQFQTDLFDGANSSSSNAVMLTVGSTTGTIWSSQIDFSVAATGTVWGSFKVASTSPPGTIRMQVEYLTATSSWALIPDADLVGNSAGFSATSTALLTVDPGVYPSLRLRANLTNVVTTPSLLDWSVLWGNKVKAPTLYLPFDNQEVATKTPTFEFMTTDPNNNPINYEISWSTSSSFTSSTTVNSATSSSVFTDVTNSLNTNPFPSGDRIRFIIPSYLQLASSTPYYWRVRARDPTASNVYSFWSTTDSVTVDTTLSVSTWFQTGEGQFNSDTLTGLFTQATDTLYVSTTTQEALIGYGESTQQTPKYRIWSGYAWSTQASALSVGGQINWVVTRASPITGEYLMGTLSTNNKVNTQVYNGSTWGNLQQINNASLSNAKARGFDIAYETLSGRALVVSCNGAPKPVYRIWSSTSSTWSSAQTINTTGANNCQWIRLASNPISNEIVMLERDTGSRFEGQVWDGSQWLTSANSTTTVGSITTTANEGMAVEYNASGTRAYVTTSNGTNNSFAWKFWSATNTTWSVTGTVAVSSRIQWMDLARDPNNNNNLVACYGDLTAPDIGVSRWTGSAWVANTNLVNSANNAGGKDVACQFETNASSTVAGRILVPYSNTVGSQYREWNGVAWMTQAVASNIGRAWTIDMKRTLDGNLLTVFFEYLTNKYQFSYWNGSTWSASSTLEASPSVTASPYLQPFMIAPKNPGTQGTIFSSAINFSDGNAPAWDKAYFSKTSSGSSTFTVQVQYLTSSSSWALIPDVNLAGNSSGTSTSPINIKNLNTDTYSVIRLVGNSLCVLGVCPTLNDWTVQWAQGLNISGTAKQHDLTTNVTSGTVAVAVNGVLQAGKTGTISGGTWTIPNVTFFPGSTVEVFVQGAATSARAVAVSVYDGPGDFTGISLNEHWLTVGSIGSTQSSTTLSHIGKYDNSVSGSTDLFFDVSAGGDLTMCALTLTSGCFDAGIYVPVGNIFQPGTTTAKIVNTYDMRIAGGVYANANTIKVGGSWRNLGGFTPGSGTVVFNGTSSPYTIDSTSAATSTFFNVTFGESGNTSTWSMSSPFIATGTVAMNFGTVAPGSGAMTLQGDLTIGASGAFSKGTATTTFSGTVAKTWIDNTIAKQDMGNVAISTSTKVITLGSSVKATNLQINSGTTLNAGGANTIAIVGFWDNLGTFTAQTGTVSFIATITGVTINQGTSNFYNTTFNGANGAWRWLNTNATTTNDLTIATGTATFPGGTLEIGGSFLNTGGAFVHNSGLVKLTSTVSGKSVQVSTSLFNDLTFSGSGGAWSFVDTNATTSGTLTITAGTPTFPSGVLEVGNNFTNSGGIFIANGGTLKFTSSLNSRTITLGGSSAANLTVQNAGIFSITDASATATGDVTFVSGTTTLPTTAFTIGGSFLNTGRFTAGSGLVTFNAGSGLKTINTGSSSLAFVNFNGAGSFTISANATSTNDLTVTSVGGFTQSSGTTLAVGGTFSNLVGGSTTTWSGSTLSLTSGTSFNINSKTSGGDLYGTLRLAANMQIRSWNSSSTVYQIDPTASLYSQNHNAVAGEVDIFGAYSRTSGTDYWDYATNFDGVALGGSSRQAVVKFASGATASFATGTTLEILGASTATTSLDRQSSGNYAITLTGATINASYYQTRNMNVAGLSLLASSTVISLANGDFSIDINGGSGMTVASSTISTNPALQILNVKFATSTGISSGFNVTETGTSTSFWRFKQHYGNYAGEAFDNDPGPSSGNPGYVRWDDSNFVISISGTVYSDAGATPMAAPTCDGITSFVRVKVAGQGNYAAPCSNVNGTYTISGVTFTGDTVMTVYLDTGGGAQAALVTKSASADLTGINLYQHRVILRHEDVNTMSIADMKAYDKTNDTDIPFTVSTSSVPFTLTTDPETSLWIWNSKTFIPGGNITLNSGGSGQNYDGTLVIDNNAIFTTQGTETHTLGGGFVANAGATFTAASSIFNFTATTTGKSIIGVAPLTFYRMIFSGSGGGWSINQALTVGENFLANAGTVSGASNVSVTGTTITGAGAIAMTGGTFTLINGGTFGGNTDWLFANLTFGNGTAATTTKTGSSTVTVSGVLTNSANHTLQAGTSSTWLFTSSGTPLILGGTFTVQNGIFRFAASGATNIPAVAYAQLDFGAAGTSSPVYTLGAGTFTVASGFNVGTSTGSLVTVNINTNDPAMTISGDVTIKASSTLILSNTGSFTARRNWTNQGTTTPSGGTVTFDATTTGFTINPGNSAFANVIFNNASGGWTIPVNATTTGTLTFTALTSFTQSPATTLEVDGVFTNSVGGAATTWASSTLYLNSGVGQTINTKSTGADIYGTLSVGANSAVRMWNSSAATSTIASTGSLYSQNHANVSGILNIYGAYTHTSGTDFWDYATDFDGASFGTSTSRQVNVRIASSSILTFSGGSLDVTGVAGATTTIDVQGSGGYALSVTGGTLNMQYYQVRGADANGLSISGTPTVGTLSNGDFLLTQNGATMMTVAGGTIDANPLKTFFNDSFATSSGITSGFNVTVTGVSASVWTISGLFGNYSGEAHDNDPGGDPGYVRWDDSAAQITISGNVYSDEGLTPIGPSACDGVTQTVQLRVQGAGTYSSACNSGTGAYSISNIIYNPQDTLTLFLSTSSAKAVNVIYDPATNVNNAHLYQNRVILRHEQGTPIGIAQMAKYDFNKNSAIPFTATTSVATSTTIQSNTGIVVWNSKVFAPAGTVTLTANASGNSWDGSVHLLATSTWSAAGSASYSIGGQFVADTAASIAPANSTFTFTATTSGKSISASNTLTFYNLTFNGAGGAWTTTGVSTTTNDFTITNGTVTLPATTLAIGGSFNNSGGAFVNNSGTVQFTSTASGKNIRTGASVFWSTLFSGSGGTWAYLDTNSTTSATTTITAGTLTLPTGIYAEGTSLDNQSGTLTANGGTLKMFATSTGKIIRLSGSSLANLLISATGTFAFSDANATTTGDVSMLFGTTTLPVNMLTIGGSFVNSAVFSAGSSTLTMNASVAGKNITVGSSSLYNLTINGASGGFIVTANATTTNNLTLTSATTFTQTSGTTLAVGGVFTNLIGGAPTTWTGSILSLFSPTNYTINTKSVGGDSYDTMRLGVNTNIRMWGSSVTTTQLDSTASLYSQNNAASSGALNIYGNYTRTSGTDYWSYVTDFDGTALGGSSRQANVRFATNATATFSNSATLQMLGNATASTSVDRISSGNYGIILNSALWNANYYQFRNMNTAGLSLTGSTTITAMNNGDFSVDVNGGSAMTISSTTVDQNASAQYFYNKFATSSGITSAYNINRTGTTTNSITFNSEYGNIAGEAYDNDGPDGCGSIRWSDSSCLISDQRGFRWRNDDGAEGAPASEWYNQSWGKRQRVRISNNATSTYTNEQVKMTIPYDSEMKSNFDDLRFTDSSGTTSIPFWIESYTTSASAIVWVKLPTLPASGTSDIFMYFANSSASYAGVGTSTFSFFDDFEDNNITEYSGDTSLYANSTTFNYERTYGLAPSTGNTGAQNTSGIGQVSAGVGRDTTFRFFQYIDSTKSDEPCFLFAIQAPITAHQNYAICLSPFGADHIVIAKDAKWNGRAASDLSTQLVSKSVTFSTGWYETSVDWIATGNQINVSVYDSVGALFATTSASNSSYTSGGVGFTFWGQNGGWDIPSARTYNYLAPSYALFTKQADSGATWAATENSYLPNYPQNQNVRLRFSIRNSSLATLNDNFQLQYTAKLAAPNCESVASASYVNVPINGSCGSEGACMSASSQFSKASSTQLLSIPTGYTFTQGQILEDPNNQSDTVSVAASQFTEVEYNFQMTNSASLDRYCFHVANGVTPLDNYSRVAEIQVLHPPVISGLSFNNNSTIALTEGTTTTIMATGTVTDLNGYADIVAASSTYYRSSVAGGRNCTADNNNCYQIATSSCGLSNCSGNFCTISCSASLYYFTDPTDIGSTYAADVWNAIVDVWDTSNAHNNSTANQDIYTLSGLTTTSTIAYGSITVGADTGNRDATTSVNNTGNSILNLDLGGDHLRAGANTISYDKQKYATSTFTYSACPICSILAPSTTPAYVLLAVPKATSTAWSPFKDVYWGISIPTGTAATTFSGFTTFGARQ